tara:strand:+ start:20432 stop:20593 length:162 start_codon:yes stop_codon:yes gene_type:complete
MNECVEQAEKQISEYRELLESDEILSLSFSERADRFLSCVEAMKITGQLPAAE